MVGTGVRRDDAAPNISSKNVFAALETLKKKKKSSVKDRKAGSQSKGSSKAPEKEPEPAPPVIWVPTPLNKSWADVDDDDDDYYKSAPVLSGWGAAGQLQQKDAGVPAEEESESEDDGLDDGDDDIEDEGEQEPEAPLPAELIVNDPPQAVAPKDPERQLSKKELKKKELEELDALLAEFAVSSKVDKSAGQTENNAATEEKNTDEQIKDGDSEHTAAASENKTSKKKKGKKEKSAKEAKDAPETADDADGFDGVTVAEAVEATAGGVDVKERIKKLATNKKKKSGKEMDSASKIASSEAAARTAKLAAAKKKEKNHYNQQPVR